jgi:hypothetical protein
MILTKVTYLSIICHHTTHLDSTETAVTVPKFCTVDIFEKEFIKRKVGKRKLKNIRCKLNVGSIKHGDSFKNNEQ